MDIQKTSLHLYYKMISENSGGIFCEVRDFLETKEGKKYISLVKKEYAKKVIKKFSLNDLYKEITFGKINK